MLHVITVLFNYCEYKIRYKLAKEFIKRYQNFSPNMKLYVVELAYENQKFQVTDKNNPYHLQLRSNTPLWHKENLINVGINKLLPEDWEYVAWIDCNLEFENSDFVEKTIEALQTSNIVQMYKTMNHPARKDTNSCSHFYYRVNNINERGLSGGAIACTKFAYQKMGKIYDFGICGGGDDILIFGLLSLNNLSKTGIMCPEYINDINNYIINLKDLKIGYVDTDVIYFKHGDIKNRKYQSRNNILYKYKYNPLKDIKYDENGVLILLNKNILNDIKIYFRNRNEDNIDIKNYKYKRNLRK